MNEHTHLVYLLRAAVGTVPVSAVPATDADGWQRTFAECRRQTVAGVVAEVVGQMPAAQRPPMALWMQWVAYVSRIQEASRRLDAEVERLRERLASVGVHMRVLKGQHAAQYYPVPASRHPGDIDAWVWMDSTKEAADIGRDLPELMRRIASLGEGKLGSATYHHAEWSLKGAEVELHYRPSFFFNPLTDRRFQQWACAIHDTTPAFDRVYMLAHIFRHVLSEGVGLRQLVDYAMLLRRHPMTDDERRETVRVLRSLHLMRLAGAVMYVMSAVFGLPDEELVVPPDERYGRRFLDEVSRSGNFGQYDDRIDRSQLATEGGSFILHTRHRLRYLTTYPHEVLWDIPFRLWHFLWRKRLSHSFTV